MDYQKLTPGTALSAGAKLWVLPDAQNCGWTSVIDWYLNLQVSQATHRSPQSIPQPLQEMIDELKIPLTKPAPFSPKSLMVVSYDKLPNEQTLILPMTDGFSKWLADAEQIWSNLGKPSLRFFLPESVSDQDFQQKWTTRLPAGQLTLVSSAPNLGAQ